MSRPLVALFALWFATVLGDPGVLHSCPMHGGHSAATTGDAGHEQHGAIHAVASQDEAPQAPVPAGPCTCVGHCCATPATAPLPTVSTFVVPAAIAANAALPETVSGDVPTSADVRLPFANGPPQL